MALSSPENSGDKARERLATTTLKAPRDGESAKNVLGATRKKLDDVDGQVGDMLLKSAYAKLGSPDELRKTAYLNYGPNRLNKVKTAVEQNRKDIDTPGTIRATLNKSLPDTLQDASGQIEKMLAGLTADPPDANEMPDMESGRYLERIALKGKDDPNAEEKSSHVYRIRQGQILDDKELIAKLRPIVPAETQAALDGLLVCLTRMEQTDPDGALRFQNRPGQSFVNENVNKMGRLGLAVVATAAAAVMGTIAVISRKWSATPLLYLGIAAVAAQPSLLNVFEPKDKRLVENASLALNNKEFKRLTGQYGIQGAAWATAVEEMMNNGGGTKNLLKAAKAGDSAKVKEYLDEISPKEVRDQLDAMNTSGGKPSDLVQFLEAITAVTGADAKELVVDYIRSGAEKQADKIKKDMRNAPTA